MGLGYSFWFLLEWIWNDRRWRRTRHRRGQPGAERHDANDLSQHSQQFSFKEVNSEKVKNKNIYHQKPQGVTFLALFVCVILFSFIEKTRMHFGFVFILFMGIPLVVNAFKNGKCDT